MKRVTYRNPVWPEYFADPFVLKVGREYYAYGTAPGDEAGRQFPVLRSADLANWQYVNHALAPIEGGTNYWAPEVAEQDGRFYLYYSASTSASDEHHRLRVAVAARPEGPFVDSGKLLLPEEGFSIDAHPFRDPKSGKWFLYYATDFTEDNPTGTGLAVVQLNDDLVSAAGKPKVVVRATCAWQIYERNRDYKGKMWEAWHCVEGPFVVYHEGKYSCLYSGGAWHTENYGLGYAVAEDPMGPWEDEFAKEGPSVLKGVAGHVIGPGHNSVVMGPDGKTMYVVYHAWDSAKTGRRMCIDPLRWEGGRPKCDGPSVEEREIVVAG